MNKSYVTLEQHVCVVCGQPYDTGTILMDKRMREKFEQHTVTGWGMCKEHTKLRADDYVALVAIDEQKSGVFTGTKIVNPEDAYRLGPVAHLKADVFDDMFDVDVPESMLCFVNLELIEKLEKINE